MLTTDSKTLLMIMNEMDKCSIKISDVPTALNEKVCDPWRVLLRFQIEDRRMSTGDFFFGSELKNV